MRKIINSTYISLDGAVEGPHLWPSIGESDEGASVQSELLFACDAVLMGRRTYEGFAPVWQTRSGDPFSDRINTMPKYVVSTTLHDPDWPNTTVIERDPAGAIAELKQEPGQDIVQYGFGRLTATMLEHGLLDEVRLWVHPLFVGGPPREDLLAPHTRAGLLALDDARTLSNGIAILTYRLA